MDLVRSFLIPLLFQFVAGDLYSDAVVNFNTDAFRKNVGSGKPHFINFFAPWCGFCKRLTPVWNELAEKYNVDPENQKVIIAKVDCTVETPLCAEEGVSGYPSLIFYPADSVEGSKFTGKRELSILEEFITLNIKPKIVEEEFIKEEAAVEPPAQKGALDLSDDNFHSTIEWGSHFVKFYAPWCGHCQTLAPVWDELADTIDTSVKISKLDCTAYKSICEEFEVKAFPTLAWIFDGKMVEKYQGQRGLSDLKRFVGNMLDAVKPTPETDEGRVPVEPKRITEIVVQLTKANFENAVNRGITFVKFFAPWCGHCRRLAPVWEELARKVVTTSGVKIAKVDCTVETELCAELKISGFPSLFIFRNGKKLSEYTSNRDLESLHKFVLEQTKHDEL